MQACTVLYIVSTLAPIIWSWRTQNLYLPYETPCMRSSRDSRGQSLLPTMASSGATTRSLLRRILLSSCQRMKLLLQPTRAQMLVLSSPTRPLPLEWTCTGLEPSVALGFIVMFSSTRQTRRGVTRGSSCIASCIRCVRSGGASGGASRHPSGTGSLLLGWARGMREPPSLLASPSMYSLLRP